nr:winged helix-turn-helix domain-containing protein [uncultured Actinoplanes sp.]
MPGRPEPRRGALRPVPDLAAEPVTVTISISGGAGHDRVLAALRDLVDAAGGGVHVSAGAEPVEVVGEGIRLDPRARTAVRDGRALALSRLEFDLLLFLARHPRQVFSRSQLLSQVWGHTHTTGRTVDVHVSRLRTKLDEPEVVTTVYGLGYRLADDAAVAVLER